MSDKKEESIVIGKYTLIAGRINAVVETSLEGFIILDKSRFDQIKEVRYYNSNFYFIYGPEVSTYLINATWPASGLIFELEREFIKISLHDSNDCYLRSLRISEPRFSLRDITSEGDLIFSVE